MNASHAILITGATGTIGREIAAHFLRTTPARLFLVARSKGGVSAENRIAEALSHTNAELGSRVSAIEGDVGRPEMGLGEEATSLLKDQVTHFIHLAAITDLTANEADLHRVNVEGTREAVRFCGLLSRLQCFAYFSTAFVGGSGRDVELAENELPASPVHANRYEASKYAAEAFVKEQMEAGKVKATIIRPSIVVGDSEEGRISSFRVIYPFLEIFARGHLTEFPALPDSSLNLVPLDFVVSSTAAILKCPKSPGHGFHQVAPHPPQLEMFLDILQELVPSAPSIKLVRPDRFDPSRLRPAERVVYDSVRPYLNYLNQTFEFDTANIERVLGENGMTLPETGHDFLRKICRHRLATL